MAKIVLDGTSINFTYSDTNKATKEKKVTIDDNTISFGNNIITLVTKANYDSKPTTTTMNAITGISNDNGNKLFLKDDNITCYICYSCYNCYNCNSCNECVSLIKCASCNECQTCVNCYKKNTCNSCAGGCNNCVSACYSNFGCHSCVSACQSCHSCVNYYKENTEYYNCSGCYNCDSQCNNCFSCVTYVASDVWRDDACGYCFSKCHGYDSTTTGNPVWTKCWWLNGCWGWCYGCHNQQWCKENNNELKFSLDVKDRKNRATPGPIESESVSVTPAVSNISDYASPVSNTVRANEGKACANCDGGCTSCNNCTSCVKCQTCIGNCHGCNSCQTCDNCTAAFNDSCKIDVDCAANY